MNRHLPYLCAVAKLPLMLAGLAWFVWSRTSTNLILSVEGVADGSALLTVPLYWVIVVMGLLVLVFPLNLMEEHFLRVNEGEAEESPARNWLIGFLWELGMLSAVGIIITVTMRFLTRDWWIALAGLWLVYDIVSARIQKLMLRADDDGDSIHANEPLRTELSAALAPYGIETGRMQLIDEEQNPHITQDIYFTKKDGKTDLFVPLEWANKWSVPELVAACLHKAWLNRPAMREKDTLLTVASGALTLGGYHAAYPWLQSVTGSGAISDLSSMPLMIAWVSTSAALLKIVGLFFFRRWIVQADAAVAQQMQSPGAMLAALKRARADSGEPPPAWAEKIFFGTPSLDRRINRLTGA